MQKILVAIDDSPNAMRALEHAVKKMKSANPAPELHIINVQPPYHGGISGFIDAGQIKQLHQEEGNKALAHARKMLDDAGIAYRHHLFVGEPAEVISRHANENGYDEILVGVRGTNPISNMLLGSVSSKLIFMTKAPVVLVK